MSKFFLLIAVTLSLFASDLDFMLNKNEAVKYYRYVCTKQETKALINLLRKTVADERFANFSELFESGRAKVYSVSLLKEYLNVLEKSQILKELDAKNGYLYLDLSSNLRKKILKSVNSIGFFELYQHAFTFIPRLKSSHNVKPIGEIEKSFVFLSEKYISDLSKLGFDQKTIKKLEIINKNLKHNAKLYK
ncbi:hypothetical protein C3L23_06985 [Nautilia sp. PV-1]|uniref:hypothetical protein n=1 Tax=Nautilia sp. PV-1 TaxID=2579250 RepID=UPI000FD8BE3E|nr:hypothetical protein [Nautilia sp. PV-1]AZV47025.1 hypothetical protein C3L23_06985 [Nautilia sp. PV-1]